MDNVYASCPPRMSDGRFVTNYSPRCLQEFGLVDENQRPLSSYMYRQYLIQNAEEIMQQQAQVAVQNFTCGACEWNTQLAPQRVQSCDSRACSISPPDYAGLGLERAAV